MTNWSAYGCREHNESEPLVTKELAPGFGASRPSWLPMPRCRVVLVCGPPAAGKSSYVQKHASAADICIDLDWIAEEYGYGRDRPPEIIGALLAERNKRLAALKRARARTAWFVLKGASASLRQWWIGRLGVQPRDVVILTAPIEELRRRILADASRRWCAERDLRLVDEWFANERFNDPGHIARGCDADGNPIDELHPWAGQ